MLQNATSIGYCYICIFASQRWLALQSSFRQIPSHHAVQATCASVQGYSEDVCPAAAAHPCRAHAKSSAAGSFSQSVGLQRLGSSHSSTAAATSASGHDESKAQQPENSTADQLSASDNCPLTGLARRYYQP